MHTSMTYVPKRPGLYAIGHVDASCHGLETRRVYAYIGEASVLQNRLRQHQVVAEQNPELQGYLLEVGSRAKVWYATTDDLSRKERLQCEAELIRRLKPACNRKGNPDKERNGDEQQR